MDEALERAGFDKDLDIDAALRGGGEGDGGAQSKGLAENQLVQTAEAEEAAEPVAHRADTNTRSARELGFGLWFGWAWERRAACLAVCHAKLLSVLSSVSRGCTRLVSPGRRVCHARHARRARLQPTNQPPALASPASLQPQASPLRRAACVLHLAIAGAR